MNLEIFENMSADQLRRYIAFLLWHYRVVDAFWFIKVSEKFDQETAERINEQVWEKTAGMAARKIVKRFDIQEKGLSGRGHKYGDAPRWPRHPSRKAREARIPGVFERRATQPGRDASAIECQRIYAHGH